MKKNGFIPIGFSNGVAAVVFFAVSILSFVPAVYQTMWNGLSLNVWVLSGLTLLIPIYNIIADYSAEKKKGSGKV